jgi:hypothetical protein
MSLLIRKSAVPEMRQLLLAQKVKQLPGTLNQVAAFSTKSSKKPLASNPRRRNGSRKPTPDVLSKSTNRKTSGSSSSSSDTDASSIGPYGLRRIDYTVVPPRWKLPPHPPPRKNPVRRYFPLVALGSGLAFFAFIIVYRDDDAMADYWKQVDSGNVPMDGDDDDDDEDLDIDDDFDEWEDVKKPQQN